MKATFLLLCILLSLSGNSQEGELDEQTIQGLEDLADKTADALDELQINEYVHYMRHPLNLNLAEEEELKALNVLNDLQITNLLLYRKLLGPLIHIYELQAIPSWDLATIRKMLPVITIEGGNHAPLIKLFIDGEQQLTFRYGNSLEPAKGFIDKKYLGGRAKLSMRYRYQYRNRISFGFTGEKDPGEPFLRLAQKAGFDFYGFHFFVRDLPRIQCLAIGDFTANMGQGLIHWQSLAFKKSAAVINIKRQSPVLRPYAATGEFNAFRGLGLTMKKHNLSTTVFLSYRRISANLDQDHPEKAVTISSFITSGNHRTVAEMQDRKVAGQLTAGGVMRFAVNGWQLSLNSVYHRFSFPILKPEEPYNLYAIKGRSFINNSLDYSFTHKNLHLFGELAIDRNFAFASIHGLMIAVDRNMDAAFLLRHIGSRYQSISGNAFTENTLPTNETGLYAAFTVRPAPSITMDCYVDLFWFPWLRYRVNAPSTGREYLLSIAFRPNKKVEAYTRFRSSAKGINKTESTEAIEPVVYTETNHWRTHVALKVNREVTVQNRLEFSTFSTDANNKKEGAMLFTDLSYKPAFKKWSVHLRLQHFTIDSYEARIYAYEGRMPSLFSIPAFYGKGKRYLLNINHSISPANFNGFRIQCSAGWIQTFFNDDITIGSGLDEIKGNRRSELSLQLLIDKH
jgi:hypothetical protein